MLHLTINSLLNKIQIPHESLNSNHYIDLMKNDISIIIYIFEGFGKLLPAITTDIPRAHISLILV
jgi:hypothetical protein